MPSLLENTVLEMLTTLPDFAGEVFSVVCQGIEAHLDRVSELEAHVPQFEHVAVVKGKSAKLLTQPCIMTIDTYPITYCYLFLNCLVFLAPLSKTFHP